MATRVLNIQHLPEVLASMLRTAGDTDVVTSREVLDYEQRAKVLTRVSNLFALYVRRCGFIHFRARLPQALTSADHCRGEAYYADAIAMWTGPNFPVEAFMRHVWHAMSCC